MSSGQSLLVAVLKGGLSAEREVSLSSGAQCAQALRDVGYQVVEIDAGADVAAELKKAAPDVVFNALHGRFGEDGAVQGLLEWMGLPYTHSGVGASATAMNKELCKLVYRAANLPVAQSVLASKSDISSAHPLPVPYVVKPYNEGSSVGIYFVNEGDDPLDVDPQMPATLMVESYVRGRELTCSVLGDRALAVTEIVTDGWYDYAAKYSDGGSRHVCLAAAA